MTATLFDFNGVLVDDERVHLEAFREVVRPMKIGISDQDYFGKYIGFDDYGAFRTILFDAKYTVSPERVRQLVESKRHVYMARIATELRVFDGAREIVARRAALGPVGIVSGALEAEIHHILERMGLAHLVAFIVPAEACRACKPDPEGYLIAKRELSRRGAAPEGAVVVEDSLAGVQAAKAAGLRCAAVAHSFDARALAAAGADVVAPSLAALDDALLDGAR